MHEVATARHLRFIHIAQECHVILVLLSASFVLIFAGPADDVGLTASDDVSLFVPYRPHADVAMCHVWCSCRRDRHPVQCVVLDIRDPHRFLTESVQCLLRGDCNCRFLRDPSRSMLLSLTSRGSLFVVILLLLSDPAVLWLPALFSSASSSLIAASAACSSHILRRSCPHISRRVARAGVLVSACGGTGYRVVGAPCSQTLLLRT